MIMIMCRSKRNLKKNSIKQKKTQIRNLEQNWNYFLLYIIIDIHSKGIYTLLHTQKNE